MKKFSESYIDNNGIFRGKVQGFTCVELPTDEMIIYGLMNGDQFHPLGYFNSKGMNMDQAFKCLCEDLAVLVDEGFEYTDDRNYNYAQSPD